MSRRGAKTSVAVKWWWDPEAEENERAGWVVRCSAGDLDRVCRTRDEVRVVRDQHRGECVQGRLFG